MVIYAARRTRTSLRRPRNFVACLSLLSRTRRASECTMRCGLLVRVPARSPKNKRRKKNFAPGHRRLRDIYVGLRSPPETITAPTSRSFSHDVTDFYYYAIKEIAVDGQMKNQSSRIVQIYSFSHIEKNTRKNGYTAKVYESQNS